MESKTLRPSEKAMELVKKLKTGIKGNAPDSDLHACADEALREAWLEEAKWFAAEIDRRGVCVTDWHRRRIADLERSAK